MESAGREPTAVLEVDDGLRLRLGVDLLVELSVLRLRIAAAFAAKVGIGIGCWLIEERHNDECRCLVLSSAQHLCRKWLVTSCESGVQTRHSCTQIDAYFYLSRCYRSSGHQRHYRLRQRRLCTSPRGCSRSRVGCRMAGPLLCSPLRRTRSCRWVVAGVLCCPGCCANAKQIDAFIRCILLCVRHLFLATAFGVNQTACWRRGGSHGPPRTQPAWQGPVQGSRQRRPRRI